MTGSVGFCVGASTISVARRLGRGIRFERFVHNGEIGGRFQSLVEELDPARLGITGNKFRKLLDVPTVSEPEAVELAFSHLRSRYPETDCIVSAGGEMFIAYVLDPKGRIKTVHTGNKCAAGTGEFFLQQIRRMGLGIEEALELAAPAVPYTVAGRCSVFCKSDCTHALNKGVPKGQVVAGLCRMMAGKILELLQKTQSRSVALIGGVSLNHVVLKMLRESIPHVYVPAEAEAFEALGALLWAEKEERAPLRSKKGLLLSAPRSFGRFPSLEEGMGLVSFKSAPPGEFHQGDYVLGLDVGSTTTKAVLMRADNRAIVAKTYLRTDGDPVRASRECYRQIGAQLPPGPAPSIIGLGVTGSGRQIAGLHALTDGVINEIVAHAAAAVHFDPEVDTIFEIGGQDAKYTWITNRVACDYAMNEACSAGTGSFLEEACLESLGIKTVEIAEIALGAGAPPNFNDQCAAFIGSDIKTAVQEGVGRDEITAGLVYSVCQNYLNRVKGNRPVGRKIFMQGGVCYNRAVPAAMAVLCGQPIIVPPEPGLMGAFGAALETQRKIELGLQPKKAFDLAALAGREVQYGEPFVCAGGKEKCDRKCSIARIVIDGRTYPFGGACSLYDQRTDKGKGGNDFVTLREEMVFRRYAPSADAAVDGAKTVGLLPSLFGSTFHPLYAQFFSRLGLRVVTASEAHSAGMEAAGASFCHPVVLSHGFLHDLLLQGVDHIFVPHVKSAAVDAPADQPNCTCPFVQAEPYYLNAAFHDELAPKLLTAVLDFKDRGQLRQTFIDLGRRLGFGKRESAAAFDHGWERFGAMRREMLERGRQFMDSLAPDETAIVLFGRSYNAFNRIGNMGIPHKFASRGYRIIPHDWLPVKEAGEEGPDSMYWTSGRQILQSAGFVHRHPKLFGAYITSFSCGPDSFLIGFFRDIMKQKPSLILELDAHTADAGVDTRIEAFLDVIRGYRELAPAASVAEPFHLPQIEMRDGEASIRTADGRHYPLTDPKVRLLIPSMGETGTEAMAAAFRYAGIHAIAAPPPGPDDLNLGKEIATCKECLPLLLTAGSLRKYLRDQHRPGEVLLYFMPSAQGPCRQGQYGVFLEKYLEKNRIADVGLLVLDCKNSYAGLSNDVTRRGLMAICISDGLDDIEAAIRALAEDPETALGAFAQAKARILHSMEKDRQSKVVEVLREEMAKLDRIRRKTSIHEATRVALLGEIYVRRDDFSRQKLVERLAGRNIVVRTAPINEWLHYADYCITHDLARKTSLADKLAVRLKQVVKNRDEAAIRQALLLSGFYKPTEVGIHDLISRAATLMNPALDTEAILTASAAMMEIGDETHGVISIGPFGCMPCRIAESILNYRLEEEKPKFSLENAAFWAERGKELALPFLAIETDGNAFPQVVEARLESFILAAHRLKEELEEKMRPLSKGFPDTVRDHHPLGHRPENLRPETESAG